MRFFLVFALSAITFLPPPAAIGDPANPAGPAAQSPPQSTSTQTPAAAPEQAPAAPSQSSRPASGQTGPESVVVRADAVDLDQVVCKELPPKIGSRIGGGRECLTQREWNRQMRESQDATRREERTGFIGR